MIPVTNVLLLNATYEPLAVIPFRRAVLLILDEKAEVVSEAADRFIRSQRLRLNMPTVVKLKHYVRVPYKSQLPLSRKAVFVRDNYKCQYCDAKAVEIDHVYPKCLGGRDTWENLVAACRDCNGRKADRTLKELNGTMQLRRKPFAPTGTNWVIIGVAAIDPDWEVYLARSPKVATA